MLHKLTLKVKIQATSASAFSLIFHLFLEGESRFVPSPKAAAVTAAAAAAACWHIAEQLLSSGTHANTHTRSARKLADQQKLLRQWRRLACFSVISDDSRCTAPLFCPQSCRVSQRGEQRGAEHNLPPTFCVHLQATSSTCALSCAKWCFLVLVLRVAQQMFGCLSWV